MNQQKRAGRAKQGSRRQRDVEALRAEESARAASVMAAVRESASQTPAAIAAWERTREALREILDESNFKLWMEPLQLVGEADGGLVLEAPARILEWVRRRYAELIRHVAADAGGMTRVALVQAADDSEKAGPWL